MRSSARCPCCASSAWAASACERHVACGTKRRATESAQTIRSGEVGVRRGGWFGRAAHASSRRTSRSGRSQSAIRVAPSHSVARPSRARSAADRRQSLRIGSNSYLDESLVSELLEEIEEVALAALGLHLKLLDDAIPDGRDARGGLEQLPDTGSHLSQAVVLAGLEAENDRLARQVGRHLVRRGDHDRGDHESATDVRCYHESSPGSTVSVSTMPKALASCVPRATPACTVAPTTCCVTHTSNNCAPEEQSGPGGDPAALGPSVQATDPQALREAEGRTGCAARGTNIARLTLTWL